MNLYILSEERPKKEVISFIVKRFAKDYNRNIKKEQINIIPEIKNGHFTFRYKVEGVQIEKINQIFIKLISGKSSFVDFLVFKTKEKPTETDSPLYLIEETKTSDRESRNTGVYQRCTKFVYGDFYYPEATKIMLYNLKVKQKENPTDTYIFGTRMLRTLGVEIEGKNLDFSLFQPFKSINEFIKQKNSMDPPNNGTPVRFKKGEDSIEITAKLEKSGYLSHDPNIGMTTIMSSCLRKLGWKKDIIITKHELPSQSIITKRNKFTKIANKINIGLKGYKIPEAKLPDKYWYYEEKSEKKGTIFAHITCENINGCKIIYSNHAGCERSYFVDIKNNQYIQIEKYEDKKKYKEGNKNYNVSIPDVVILDPKKKVIINGEGKTYKNRNQGVKDLENFDYFEKEYLTKFYPKYDIIRTVILFGSNAEKLDDDRMSLLLNESGKIIINKKAPNTLKESVEELLNLNKINQLP